MQELLSPSVQVNGVFELPTKIEIHCFLRVRTDARDLAILVMCIQDDGLMSLEE